MNGTSNIYIFAYIAAGFGIAVALISVSGMIRVVSAGQAWIIERHGRYHRTVRTGLTFLIPFMDSIRCKHMLKEQCLEVNCTVADCDGTPLNIVCVVFFEIVDPVAATYQTSNPVREVTNSTASVVGRIIATGLYGKWLDSRSDTGAALLPPLTRAMKPFGVGIVCLEIKSLQLPDDVARALKNLALSSRAKLPDET